jgi:uncharacterized protein (DUF305 family)
MLNQQEQNLTALNYLRIIFYAVLISIVPICLQAMTAQAQVSPAAAPAAGMPSATMPKDMPNMPMDKGAMAMHQSMMSGMEEMKKLPMSGNIDRDFAVMMRAHHQQGVDMAEAQIKYGKSAEMKVMAKNIIKAQKKEITQFDKWLTRQGVR